MKKIISFSGMQPTGILTIGNYIGAIKQWINIQNKYICFICIVDLHSIISNKNKKNIYKISLDTLALYLSCGIDPYKNVIFLQSTIPEHSQLSWILNCYTYFGEMKRMNQFKNIKNIKNKNINIGLFNYPILMASDILLYQTNIVPVGIDQKQHIELTRIIGKRFNKINGKIFTIPKILISKNGSKIMSLLNPTKKMSKSDKNLNNIITLLDSPKSIFKKIKISLTDSEIPHTIKYDVTNKPGISNLLNILSSITNIPIYILENNFNGKPYKIFKEFISETIIKLLTKIQFKYSIFRKDETFLKKILKIGEEKSRTIAQITLKNVYKSLGLI